MYVGYRQIAASRPTMAVAETYLGDFRHAVK